MKRLREKFRNLAYGLAVHALALTISLAPVGANAISDADQAVREREVERDAEIAEKNAEDAAKAARDRAAQNQKDAQQSAAKGSEKGGMMANILGMALMAGGAVMVTVGTVPCAEGACNWPLIAAGVFTIAGGVGSMMAGQAMNKNADKGFQNVGGLDSIGPLGTATTPTTTGKMKVAGDQSSNSAKGEEAIATAGNKVDIDPDQLRNGKLGEIMDKFEAATGIKRDDFARGVAAGISPAELLKGVGGLSKDELQNAIDNAANTGGAGGGAIGAGDIEKLAKDMGLEDMYAKAVNDEGVDFGAGGGASRALASAGAAAGTPGFDFGKLGAAEATPPKDTGLDMSLLSDEVKKQLAKEGRTGLTLFQIVSARYRKVTPMMFGQEVETGGVAAGPAKTLFVDDTLMQ